METPKIARISFGNKLDFTNFPTLIFPFNAKGIENNPELRLIFGIVFQLIMNFGNFIIWFFELWV
jgi:hypothetical protein